MARVLLQDLPQYAANVLAAIKLHVPMDGAFIVALHGDLGSGKTTLVQEVFKLAGINERVMSPTYVLMKSYAAEGSTTPFGTPRKFDRYIHIDAYRLESPEEFAALRPEEFLSDPRTIVFIEWPEKLGSALPVPDLTVEFSSEGASEGERYIEMV